MQIISGTTDFLLQGASAVAIGKFDGMHRGHKALLSEILEAKKRGLQAVVFTVDPPPAVLFSGKQSKGGRRGTERDGCFDRSELMC